MRYARIIPAAGPTWIIGDDAMARGPGSKYILGGWPAFKQIVQNIAYLDGAFTANLAKGNRDVRFQIVAEYEFSNESECFLFICNLPNRCPSGGVLEMGVRGSTGGGFRWPSCVVESVEPVGDASVTSVRIAYALVVGRPS